MTVRFAILQVVAAALFVAAWWMGWPQYLYNGDKTYLTAVIAGLGVLGIVAGALNRWRMVDFLIRGLPRYGLFGTVVGLAIVATHSGGQFEIILGGMATAFNTTICGLVGAEWLRVTRHLT